MRMKPGRTELARTDHAGFELRVCRSNPKTTHPICRQTQSRMMDRRRREGLPAVFHSRSDTTKASPEAESHHCRCAARGSCTIRHDKRATANPATQSCKIEAI